MTHKSSPPSVTNPFKDDMTGRVLLGRYRIVRKLATGGMGVVYLARTEGARGFVKPVVVKLILPGFASDESFLRMFVREAQILSKLNDPGIVSVIDFEQETDFYIMVLEYVHGFQLREWMKYRGYMKKPLPTDVVLQIILNVLIPLHHAHTVIDSDGTILGVVHQDISPSNILLNTDGRVKLVDFGVARAMNPNEERNTAGGFKGKLSYSAPERFAGNAATVKCDLYSVGVTLHELLVGKNEFFAKNHVHTISRVLHHEPSAVSLLRPDASKELDEVVNRALAKDPDYRFASALEFADAVRPLLNKDSIELDKEISQLVYEDFNNDMAAFLNVEPLGMREKAWRRPSVPPEDIPEEHTRRISKGEIAHLVGDSVEATVSLRPESSQSQIDRSLAPTVVPAGRKNISNIATLADPIAESIPETKNVVVPIKALIILGIIVLATAGAIVAFFNNQVPKQQKKIVLVQSPVVDDETQIVQPKTPTPDSAASTDSDDSQESPLPSGQKGKNNESTQPSKKIPKKMSTEQQQLMRLTSAFKKQKTKVKSCFKNYPDDIKNIQQISVVFSVKSDGSTSSVSVRPNALNGSALGSCIERVAASTKFPKQSSPITFTIPVRVSK